VTSRGTRTTGSRGRVIAALSIAATGLLSTRAEAQTVSDVLTFLITNQSIATGNFALDRAAAQATRDTIAHALVANLATLPVSSSSGAFVYRLNTELGTVERASQSFGPFFVERALTVGQGRAAFGITFQHLRFTQLDGRSLSDGTLVTTANRFVDEPTPFDEDRLRLDIGADVATFYGSVGLGPRVEIGFAAPMVALTMSGERIDTYRGRPFTQATASATAIGLADILARTKFTLFSEGGAAVASAVELRVPTGRTEDLLGAGTASVKISGIGSLERGAASVHANAGLSFGGIAHEIDYGGAVSLAASPRVSVSSEVVGRWLDGVGGIVPVAAPHPTLIGVETIRLEGDNSRLHMMTVIPGIKWNVADTWVVVANVAVPITSDGLRPAVTPFIGIDYSVGR